MRELNIIDENDNVTGKDTRENIHKDGLLHREIHIWIYNKKGEVLFQRRAKTKETNPNLLSVSVGGHVEIGDDYLRTAIKELEEETGIKAEAGDLIYITTMRRNSHHKDTGIKNNTIKKVYAYKFNGDASSLRLEKGEATGFEFWSIDKIINLNAEEKKEFVPAINDIEYLQILKSIKELSRLSN